MLLTKERSPSTLQNIQIEELSEIWDGLIEIRDILLEQKIYIKGDNDIVEIDLEMIDRRIRQIVLELNRRCTPSKNS